MRANDIDNVKNPKYYSNGCSIECIDSMEIAFGADKLVTFCIMNTYKYVWRYKNKNGVEDLKKAQWYLDKIEEIENRSVYCMNDIYQQKDKLKQLVEEGLKRYEK